MNTKKIWKVIKSVLQWILVVVISIVVAIAIRVFLLASFKIPTGSMMDTIQPGDFILVNKMIPGPRIFTDWGFLNGTNWELRRLKGYRKVKRNEVLVFNFPYSGDWGKIDMDFNVFYAKRCIAVPGDTFYTDNGIYRIKGLSDTLGYYPYQQQISERSPDTFGPNIYNCFPGHPSFGWNMKYFGPLYIPGEGDRIVLDTLNMILYKNLIEYETKETLSRKNDTVYLNDSILKEYVFKYNYYFMAGDFALDSRDSRYWGLLPEDHIVGKAFVIWRSRDIHTGKIRWKRIFKRVK